MQRLALSVRSAALLPLLALCPGALSHGAVPHGTAPPFPRPALHDDVWTSARPDGHAPIGVMGDHRHAAGEWMVSYRLMRMSMEGNLVGTNSVSDTDVVAANGPFGFTVTPTDMDMDMHMLGLMYAPSDSVTLLAMVPFLDSSMDHLVRNGNRFATQSDGLGDVKVGALIGLQEGEGDSLHLNAGLSLPTSSITETDDTPLGVQRLPFPMQLGSGTLDLQPGLTYLVQEDDWSGGLQGLHTVRLDENDEGYRLGSRTDASAWLARRVSDRWSVSVRLAAARWGDIVGDDPAPPPATFVPTANPNLRAGKRLDAGLGVNLLTKGGHRIALEALLPVYQDLDGPQLETDLTVVIGYQYAWGGSH